MGNQEHRLGGTLPHLQEQLLHLLAGEGIQCAEGFIHQQHPRVGGQRTSQAHTLLLPTGQLPDTPAAKPGKVNQGEHFAGLLFPLRTWHTGQFQAEGNVAQHVLPRQ